MQSPLRVMASCLCAEPSEGHGDTVALLLQASVLSSFAFPCNTFSLSLIHDTRLNSDSMRHAAHHPQLKQVALHLRGCKQRPNASVAALIVHVTAVKHSVAQRSGRAAVTG